MPLKKKTVAMIIAAGGLSCTSAWPASVSVVGLFKDKAIVSIDGGKPRKVGGITVNQVDGMVVESGLDMPLLGMSFLNRMEMKRDGQTMTLTQRY